MTILIDDPSSESRHREERISNAATPTLFSFGYWGAGSATRALVEAVNEGESLRGFQPPLWVDIRLSRAVRAVGFQGNAFGDLLGKSGYLWMKELGNARVRDHSGGIEIEDPRAAEDLLNHALDNPKRRVIFFCACASPASCHRHEVALLLKESAKRRGIEVNVVEWPGGKPEKVTIAVSVGVLRALARAPKATLALPAGMTPGAAALLPWGTQATLRAGTETMQVMIGPALFSGRGANLQLLIFNPDVEDAAHFRDEEGYEYLA